MVLWWWWWWWWWWWCCITSWLNPVMVFLLLWFIVWIVCGGQALLIYKTHSQTSKGSWFLAAPSCQCFNDSMLQWFKCNVCLLYVNLYEDSIVFYNPTFFTGTPIPPSGVICHLVVESPTFFYFIYNFSRPLPSPVIVLVTFFFLQGGF